MISVTTVQALHNQNYALGLYCLSCNRSGEANLDRPIQNGKGDKPVTEADSGAGIVDKQVRPPAPEIGAQSRT